MSIDAQLAPYSLFRLNLSDHSAVAWGVPIPDRNAGHFPNWIELACRIEGIRWGVVLRIRCTFRRSLIMQWFSMKETCLAWPFDILK